MEVAGGCLSTFLQGRSKDLSQGVAKCATSPRLVFGTE